MPDNLQTIDSEASSSLNVGWFAELASPGYYDTSFADNINYYLKMLCFGISANMAILVNVMNFSELLLSAWPDSLQSTGRTEQKCTGW